jgi:hypothetical protein
MCLIRDSGSVGHSYPVALSIRDAFNRLQFSAAS